MKLTKDVNLLFFSALKNDIFLYFLCHSNRLVFNWYWVHTLIKIENLLSFLYTSVQNYFGNSLMQILKFTWNKVDK